ncbi:MULTISPECIES: hypothetical protein [Bradyrhizobium]|uniref:hypothetical protein n=1 Tax=Bradyrhizobium TaxID=374 RepID=UPI002363D9B1|nr:hypothetical protein [Bradyrhizobium sp. WBAH30]
MLVAKKSCVVIALFKSVMTASCETKPKSAKAQEVSCDEIMSARAAIAHGASNLREQFAESVAKQTGLLPIDPLTSAP